MKFSYDCVVMSAKLKKVTTVRAKYAFMFEYNTVLGTTFTELKVASH